MWYKEDLFENIFKLRCKERLRSEPKMREQNFWLRKETVIKHCAINTREVCTSCKCHTENRTAFPELRGHSSEFERIYNNILIQHMKYNCNMLNIFYTT